MESANLKFFYGTSSSCLRLFRLRGILFSFKQNMFRGGVVMPSEKEIAKIELATLYEVRLAVDTSDKETYTKQEVKAMLDQIAIAKKQ